MCTKYKYFKGRSLCLWLSGSISGLCTLDQCMLQVAFQMPGYPIKLLYSQLYSKLNNSNYSAPLVRDVLHNHVYMYMYVYVHIYCTCIIDVLPFHSHLPPSPFVSSSLLIRTLPHFTLLPLSPTSLSHFISLGGDVSKQLTSESYSCLVSLCSLWLPSLRATKLLSS